MGNTPERVEPTTAVPRDDRSQELTSARVERYIEGHGSRCPYCDSDDISAGTFEGDADSAWSSVECRACGRVWQDVFRLSAVDVFDEDGRYATIEPAADRAELAGEMARDTNPAAGSDLEALFEAADAHGVATGHPDDVIGDLQVILRAAWRIMTPAQLGALWRAPELAALAERPEYAPLFPHPLPLR